MNIEKLQEMLQDHQTGMSQFQDDYFVTARAGGTVYGCYKQSLRELYKRFRGLREARCDRKKMQIEIEKHKHLSENETDEFEARLAEVEFERKSMQMEECDRVIKDTEREFVRFYQQAHFLKEQIGELDDVKRLKLDEEMWEYKIKEMAALDFVTTGRLGRSTYEFVNALPERLKEKLLTDILMTNQKGEKYILNWYENKKDYVIPDQLPQVAIDMEKLSLTFKEELT